MVPFTIHGTARSKKVPLPEATAPPVARGSAGAETFISTVSFVFSLNAMDLLCCGFQIIL